eukprot:3113463-Karenia_brevis.AAC.1
MCKLSDAFANNDSREWPLEQDTVREIITVRLVRGHEALTYQFKQLKVPSRIVKQMASIYADKHLSDLMKNQKVVTLLSERKGTLREQFLKHINIRVNQAYPEKEFA